MNRYICIHGHFYQPPRENPWLEEVELQDSAFPYHDWNERITAECYGPNAAARILDPNQNIREIVNNYTRISFDFGPTLLSWMERQAPEVYRSVLDADLESRMLFSGHGSALAQAYNHMIMPLANSRDKRTQVLWGIADFEHRFGRRPEGMWLPETAIDLETLEILAANGILFTILAPRQAHRVRRLGRKNWIDVRGARIDPKITYLCRLPSGQSINLFFYDGPVSQDIAFAGLLHNGERLARRWMNGFREDQQAPQLVSVATDGESYGHHHRYGEMALAFALRQIQADKLARVTVYGEYLVLHPPAHEVEIIENSSWSCEHGVERWRAHCGCNTGRDGWRQHWRAPLRDALNWLRDEVAFLYEMEGARLLLDPWRARDEYIQVILDRSTENVEKFLARHAMNPPGHAEKVKILRLLEMQRHAMLMFTSCGWFFDEISGLETVQVMRYAARSTQLAERACGVRLETALLQKLREAPSNLTEYGNGAVVYEKLAGTATVDLMRVGAHYAISSLFEDYQEQEKIFCYSADRDQFERRKAGRHKIAVGKVRLRSNITWAEKLISFSVLHLGEQNLLGGVREYRDEEAFGEMRLAINEAFNRGDFPGIIRSMDYHFDTHSYSLWHLFRDEQRKILNWVLEGTMREVETVFRQIYENNYPIMLAMREMGVPLPQALMVPAEYAITSRLRQLFETDWPDLNQLRDLIREIRKWSFENEKDLTGYVASQKMDDLMTRFESNPDNIKLMQLIDTMLHLFASSAFKLDLMKAQDLHFRIGRRVLPAMTARAEQGDGWAITWIQTFESIGTRLQVRVG